MIAKYLLFFLAVIILPDAWLQWRYRRRRGKWTWLNVLLTIGMVAYTVCMALQKDFEPSDRDFFYGYLFLFGLIAVPRLVYCLCSMVGRLIARRLHSTHNYGNLIGLLGVMAVWYILIYGSFVGFQQLQVRHVDYTSADLPDAFDGYRIVQFSDAHVGTLTGSRQWLLERAVDSINAQRADVIVFTGDLQNGHPAELYPHRDVLSRLAAKDGVFSVLGNHDYANYITADEVAKKANCRETQSLERQMGFQLLMNEHRAIRRGNDSIVIAGMENWGSVKRMPRLGNVQQTLKGVDSTAFVVMLQHDPTAWRAKILPECDAQLTLSGHTHGGQFALFGLSPVALAYSEWEGTTYEGHRALHVSTGLGGLIPFRFGVPGEIVVITLHQDKTKKQP